jgi:predicted RNA binding protein YcfA (HicA-like mRNA interferase family)
MKVTDVLKRLRADGWTQVRMRGSHRQLRHPKKSGDVTVSGHQSKDVPVNTLKSIWKQAGLEE